MKYFQSTLIAFGMLLFGSNAAVADKEKEILTFGIVPQQSAGQLARNWGPIFKYVEEKTGVTLRFATAPSIPEFERRMAMGEYDFSYMNPYHYTVFHESQGYQAFAKAKDKRIKGIVVVRKDSPITDMSQLDDTTMAFPAPAAFAASVLPRAFLSRENINVTPKYVSSHDSVYLAVARGLYPAGGGIVRTLKSIHPSVRDQLKILWTTKGYTSHALASHPRVSPEVVALVQEALVSLQHTEQGKEHLKALSWKGVEPADNERWDDVRGLGLELLDMLINGT